MSMEIKMRQLVKTLAGDARATAGYLIVRAQTTREWGLRFSNGRCERVSTGSESGLGVQAFTASGACGFAAADTLDPEEGCNLVARAMSLAERNEKIGTRLNREIWQAGRDDAVMPSPAAMRFDAVSLNEIQDILLRLHNHVREIAPQANWQTSYRQIEHHWCIGRSDGTLVSFTIPRAVLIHQGTVRADGKAQGTLVHRSGTDAGVLLAEDQDRALAGRAADRAGFARRVCQAPPLPPGHYPLIIDYGLAKGLAHEAFGHAVESDQMTQSVLGEQGRLKQGLQVAGSGVHIVDGPLTGDWAYQPYSANGIPRQTVQIVRNGILEAGLADIFSAEEAGMTVSGAGRAEGYYAVPIPRMSNIRLELDRRIPLAAGANLWEEIGRLREALLRAGEIVEGKKNLLLLGYRGGQVNPKTGNFVFQCDGIVDVARAQLDVFQPAIFSGQLLSALQAIRGGVGDTCFDAIGTCGKSGQSVPSSGGSNRYVLLAEDPNVSLGGGGS